MFYHGRHKDKYRKDKGDVIVFAKKYGNEAVIVKRDEVKNYVEDPVFVYYLSVYNYIKLWGLPNNCGWVNEDSVMIDAITALELEAKDIEYESLNNAQNNGGNDDVKSMLRKGAL